MSKPLAWINAITGDVTTVDCSDTLLWAPLYLATPKQEPLSYLRVLVGLDTKNSYEYQDGFIDGVLYAEKEHGIGVEQ